MREGQNLQEVATSIREQLQSKHDYRPYASKLQFETLWENISKSLEAPSSNGNGREVQVLDLGHNHQVNAEWYQNPAEYRRRMQGGMATPDAPPVPAATQLRIPGQFTLDGNDVAYPLNAHANRQLSEFLGIPPGYYSRLQAEYPDLLTVNVNTLLAAQKPNTVRTVRTLNGQVRAVLSDSYEVRDNWDLLRFLIPLFYPKQTDPNKPDYWSTIIDTGVPGRSVRLQGIRDAAGNPLQVQFPSCEITDESLYIKMVVPSMTVQLRVGATVRWGAIVKNNEIGKGSTAIYPFWEVLECTNGAFSTELGNTNRHVGRAKGALSFGGLGGNGNDAERYFSDASRIAEEARKRAADREYFLKMVDVVRGTLNEASMRTVLAPMKDSMAVEITGNKEAAIEQVGRMMDLSEGEQDGVLETFINSKDYTIWGVSQAITLYSQQVESYDRATELEGAGGNVITLDPSQWKVIAEAKKPHRKSRPVYSRV